MRSANRGNPLAKGRFRTFHERRIGFKNVELVQNHDLGFMEEALVKETELLADHDVAFDQMLQRQIEAVLLVFLVRPGCVFKELCAIQKVDKETSAFDVFQELMPQARATVSAFDQPWNIGYDKALLIRREMSVDLPAFGYPMIPTSARSLSSSLISRFSPSSPGCANLGA